MIIFLFTYLLLGIAMYVKGLYIKKNPYSDVAKNPQLLSSAPSRAALEQYSFRLSKTYRLFGVFYVIAAFVQYLIDCNDVTVALFFIPLLIFVFLCGYCQKTVTGKFAVAPVVAVRVVAVMSAGFGILVGWAFMETSITVDDKNITLSGVYGETVPIAELKEVFITDTLPCISLRTNGISTGKNLNKGYFRAKSLGGNVKLLLHSGEPPFIYFKTMKRYIILNFRNKEKTQQTYEQLKQIL
jgi:hypothetical protein